MKSILVLTVGLLISGAGCESGPHKENLEFLTIGPYTGTCYGLAEQECFLAYNQANRRWEFFYEEIQGFAFEPGFVYILEVRVEDLGTEILDAGRYAYHLTGIFSKREVSGGSYATGFIIDGERLYTGRDSSSDTDQVPVPVVVHPDTWEPPVLSEAAVLADRILRREHGSLLIDPTERRELAAEITPVLSGIREVYPELADIAVQAPYALGQLVLTLETWLFEAVASLVEDQTGPVMLRTGHAPFDTLTEKLGLSVVLDQFPRFGVVIFYFSEYLNAPAAAALYEAMEGVKFAEPNGRLGDGPDIDMSWSEDRWYVVTRRAWGDCPSGCLYEEFHFFIADDAGVERIEPSQAAAIAEFRELAVTSPETLSVFAVDLPHGHRLAMWLANHPGAGSLLVPAGEYRDAGGVRFTCPSEGADCEVAFVYSYCRPDDCVDGLPGAVSLGGAATAQLARSTNDREDHGFSGHVTNDRLSGKVIIDDTGPGAGAWTNDPYVIETDRDDGLVIDGDTLTVTVSYSGGCEEHDFALVTAGEFRDSHPVELEVILAHDAHGDRCRAYPTETRHFDLTPIRALYRTVYQTDTGSVLLNLTAAREAAYQLVYTFGE